MENSSYSPDLGFDKISDILDSSEAEHRFEDLYLKAILEPNKAEDHLKAFINAFSKDAESEHASNALLGSEQSIEISIAREYCHHLLPVWLEIMVMNYLLSHGGSVSRSLAGCDIKWKDGWTIRSAIFSANENRKRGHTGLSYEQTSSRCFKKFPVSSKSAIRGNQYDKGSIGC